MNTNIKCQAKDPNSCRYHRPSAGQLALKKVEDKKKIYEQEIRKIAIASQLDTEEGYDTQKYLEAKHEFNEAEEEYDATAEGLAALDKQISQLHHPTSGPNVDEAKLYDLEHRKALAFWRLEAAESKNLIDYAYGGSLIPSEHSYVPAGASAGGNYLWPESIGNKYDSNMTLVQVKSNVIKDIKEAQKKGYLPSHIGFKLRANKNSLRVTILDVPEAQLYEDETQMRTSEDAIELKDRVNQILSAYNRTQYDTIEGRTNTAKFWGNVSFEDAWDREKRNRLVK